MSTERRVPIDALVVGQVGLRDMHAEGRVYHVSPHGWVAYLDADGKQWISYAGRFLVKGPPRPEKQRTEVPERLKR